MKSIKTILFMMMAIVLLSSFAFAAGDAVKGKAFFNDTKAFAGTSACNYCHTNGKGLENAADKKEFKAMGKPRKGLEEMVNSCIANSSKGKAVDPKSEQMQNTIAYIKSLKVKAAAPAAPGY
ncbi:MAG: hypothetical protein HZA16_12390 [Nitrospirae bacterium]|nr:hypothetical protein [Nitrospirota bacterium]